MIFFHRLVSTNTGVAPVVHTLRSILDSLPICTFHVLPPLVPTHEKELYLILNLGGVGVAPGQAAMNRSSSAHRGSKARGVVPCLEFQLQQCRSEARRELVLFVFTIRTAVAQPLHFGGRNKYPENKRASKWSHKAVSFQVCGSGFERQIFLRQSF